MMYQCKHCSCSFTTQKKYVSHYKMHRNQANIKFPCGFSECNREFRTYSAFKSHVLRDHVRTDHSNNNLLNEQDFSVEMQENSFLCAVDGCGDTFSKYFDFKKHLKSHIIRHGDVNCPFQNCSLKFNKVSSFTSHLSRKHKAADTNSLLTNFTATSTGQNENQPAINEENENSIPFDYAYVNDTEEENIANVENIYTDQDREQFLHNLACFYMKLQSKYLLPISTIQLIIDEFQDVHRVNQDLIKQSLVKKMKDLNLSDEAITEIIFILLNRDEFTACNDGPLKTNQRRTSFYKNNFGFIEPAQVVLSQEPQGNSKIPSYQYVSILESIKMLYQKFPESFCFRSTAGNDSEDILSDVFDGKVYKKNKLFNSVEKSFQVMLYQDAFEVVNPLGAAKKKHKLIGVYYTLANFEAHNRSNIDHMQLVMLCKETHLKEFGSEAVFSKLVEELKVLESIGIYVGHEFIRGSVLCIVGDNLGSHMIGGYVESFTATYFCRYCCITNKEFQDSDGTAVSCSRTVENYNQCAEVAHENRPSQHYQGVKATSIFNSLEFYHVAMPGLPPCIGHDLFEGVVAFDMALIIKQLVEEGNFTCEQLNRKIESFEYKDNDALDRPCSFNSKSDKISGAAIQNWVFVRLFPYFVGSYIKDTDSNVWQLYLKLKAIVEIVCSPVISCGQVAYLKVCMEEYLCDRKSLFPNTPLRPKHHFLNHYAEMILYFGPLIHTWTIRFESKHSYFKQCARKFHNYKHLAKTLATRHQLLQAYYTSGDLFSPEINCDSGIPFLKENYSLSFKHAVQDKNFSSQSTLISNKVVYRGLNYHTGMTVLISFADDHVDRCLIIGLIKGILIENKSLYLLVATGKAEYAAQFGLYFVTYDVNPQISCVMVSQLLDLCPVVEYSGHGGKCISLKHCVEK